MQPRALISAVFALFLACSQAFGAATLLPNGEQCFQAQAGLNGMVGVLGTITAGSGGTSGTYGGIALTGGSGSGATANITVSGGAVTAVTVLNPGIQYVTGDVLSASSAAIGNTSGFSVPVSSTSINSSLAGGKVYFYVPNTSTFKSTWFNADQAITHQNTNPVQLDQNGCAIIYGIGSYRQVLQDSLGDTVWDQVTTDTSANNNTFWAGIAGGTPNAILVTDPGFNATDGSIINFTALATNTSSTTLLPSGYLGGPIPVLKNTTAGPVSLTGGEIVQNNPVSVIYSAVANSFNLLNTAIPSSSGSTAPLCGATGLVLNNDSGTPGTSIDIAAGQVVMLTPNGLIINRSSVSLVLNATVSGANGIDTGILAATTWYYVWLIDNGASTAALLSTYFASPTMPSGYNYKCRLGSVSTNSGTNFFRFIQRGTWSQYVVTGTNPFASLPFVANGASGSSCATTSPVYTAVPINSVGTAAPTASEIRVVVITNFNGGGGANIAVAPNTNYFGQGSSGGGFYTIPNTVTNFQTPIGMVLESSNIAYCSSTNGGALLMQGYKDTFNAN